MMYLSFDCFYRINHLLILICIKLFQKLMLRLTLSKFSFCHMTEQSVTRCDVTFFVLSIFFSGNLYGIVGELHKNLFIIWNIWVILLIFFRTCSHVTFFEAIEFTVMGVKNSPYSDVEFTIHVKQRLFNELLNNESETFKFFFFGIILNTTISPRYVIMVMSLEYAHLISFTSSNSVTFTHYLSQLVKCLENMNSNSSIESCRLEQPQVLSTLTTSVYLISGFD